MTILKEVDNFRVVEIPAVYPSCPTDTIFEVLFAHHYWQDNHIQEEWEILRVIIHENKEYARATALNIFDILTRPY